VHRKDAINRSGWAKLQRNVCCKPESPSENGKQELRICVWKKKSASSRHVPASREKEKKETALFWKEGNEGTRGGEKKNMRPAKPVR